MIAEVANELPIIALPSHAGYRMACDPSNPLDVYSGAGDAYGAGERGREAFPCPRRVGSQDRPSGPYGRTDRPDARPVPMAGGEDAEYRPSIHKPAFRRAGELFGGGRGIHRGGEAELVRVRNLWIKRKPPNIARGRKQTMNESRSSLGEHFYYILAHSSKKIKQKGVKK